MQTIFELYEKCLLRSNLTLNTSPSHIQYDNEQPTYIMYNLSPTFSLNLKQTAFFQHKPVFYSSGEEIWTS